MRTTTDRCLAAQALVVMNPDIFWPGFDIWLDQNWPIYVAFEHYAMQRRKEGHKHYSARAIAEYIRHHTTLKENDRVLKLNDHFTPSLARMFIKLNPECEGFFELRSPVMEPSRRAA